MGLHLKFNLALAGLAAMSYALLITYAPTLLAPAWAIAFLAVWCVGVNLLLGWLVLAPLRGLLQGAQRISTGQADAPDLPTLGCAEFAQLSSSFNRMRRSLDKAMQVIAMDPRL
jgi:nitrate/nitrite-specific signal transduction histidine kinase